MITTLLVLCMAFGLCACGGGNAGTNTEKNSESEQTQQESQISENSESEESESLEAGKAIYKVIVVDEGGNVIKGAMVQMCLESCIFGETNEEGVAEFKLDEAEGYKAEVLALPEGYEEISEEPVYLEAGKQEVTLTVRAIQ